MKEEVVFCTTEEEWLFVNNQLPLDKQLNLKTWKERTSGGSNYVKGICKSLNKKEYSSLEWYKNANYTIYSFEEWKINFNLNNKNKEQSMEKTMLDVLNKTYDNLKLRRTTVPLFMSNPGIGKTTIIKKFAEERGINMVKITLSQRMPNEVVGGMMPNKETKTWEVYNSEELQTLKDGDILFFDEVFNGTLKQTLDAMLNLLEDRTLPSGIKLADVMIVAASNPQGLINLTPQIKERFIKWDLKFVPEEYRALLKKEYGMPEAISSHLCTLINKEKFEHDSWNFVTPRSIEKAINQAGCDLEGPYTDMILPYLSEEIISPSPISILGVKEGDKVKYIEILKLIIKKKAENDSKNHKQESRTTSDLLG